MVIWANNRLTSTKQVVKISDENRFQREHSALLALKGENNIIQVVRSVHTEQFHCLIFPKYSLQPFVPCDDSERIRYMHDVLNALVYCGAKGIMHQ